MAGRSIGFFVSGRINACLADTSPTAKRGVHEVSSDPGPAIAAAKAGFSTATAYRIEADPRLPSHKHQCRCHATLQGPAHARDKIGMTAAHPLEDRHRTGIQRLSSPTSSSVHNQLKSYVAIGLFLPACLDAWFSIVLIQLTTLVRPFDVLAAARGDRLPSMGIGWSSKSR